MVYHGVGCALFVQRAALGWTHGSVPDDLYFCIGALVNALVACIAKGDALVAVQQTVGLSDVKRRVGSRLNTESPRILRRLKSLRGLSHEEVKQVFTRGSGTRSTNGAGAPRRVTLALGGH